MTFESGRAGIISKPSGRCPLPAPDRIAHLGDEKVDNTTDSDRYTTSVRQSQDDPALKIRVR